MRTAGGEEAQSQQRVPRKAVLVMEKGAATQRAQSVRRKLTNFDRRAAVLVRGTAPSARLAADAHAAVASGRGADHGAHGTLLLWERRAR